MADELAKKISELDTLPGGNLDGFFTIGSKNNSGGSPVSYKVNLGIIVTALSQAAAAVSSANSAVAAAQAAQAAFDSAVVQVTGSNTDKTMSQAAITDALTRIQRSITDLTGTVGGVLDLIPTETNPNNQLADKAFVNSSISSQTASLITDNGQPFSSLSDLQQVTASENDYAYVVVAGAGGTYYDRYKYTNGAWALEFRVNSTVFTAAQWAAVNSTITLELVTKLSGLPSSFAAITNNEIDTICT